MADPYLAGVDPIFWLHHCNVDRLWEAWMNTSGKTMVRDQRWLDGPAGRTFIMPVAGSGQPGSTFTGRDCLRGGRLQPRYANLSAGTGVTPGSATVAHIKMGAPEQQKVVHIGANAMAVKVGATMEHSQVDLEPVAVAAGVATMGVTEPGREVARLYLALESVRGSVST